MTENIVPQTRTRCDILDGLRGVAAIMVVVYHILEIYGLDPFDLLIPHGHLAVDFFFALSGFVIGYAYDARWTKMTFASFMRRRIIRLQPMVVFGMVLGAVLFYFGASELFPLIAQTPVWKLLLYLLLGILLIPTPPCIDTRGWQETYTLDGPAWTLFFEYIANILYALVVRRFTTKMLGVVVALCGCLTIFLNVARGGIYGGWVFNPDNLLVGFTRLLYPFFAGLLLFRLKKTGSVRNAFLWCAILLVGLFFVPRLGGREHTWLNGLFETITIVAIFPLILFVGAGSSVSGGWKRACRFLGGISYPIYLINYPILYLNSAWVTANHVKVQDAVWHSAAIFVVIFLVSCVAYRWYDQPLQKWLKRRYLRE